MAKTTRRMCKTPMESFTTRTERRGDCLVWTGALRPNGYGVIWDGHRVARVHRWAYQQFVGPIPDGADIDHICGNRACCEPAHLRPTTRKQNMENLTVLYPVNTSGVRGVSWDGRYSKWRVRVKHNYVERWGGYFDTLAEAEAKAIELRNELFTHNNADRVFEGVAQ